MDATLTRQLIPRRMPVTLAVLVVLFAGYTLTGFFLVTRLVATYVPRYVEEQPKRRAQIGEIRMNPLRLTIDVKNFQLTEADGSPLLGFDRLLVDAALANGRVEAGAPEAARGAEREGIPSRLVLGAVGSSSSRPSTSIPRRRACRVSSTR